MTQLLNDLEFDLKLLRMKHDSDKALKEDKAKNKIEIATKSTEIISENIYSHCPKFRNKVESSHENESGCCDKCFIGNISGSQNVSVCESRLDRFKKVIISALEENGFKLAHFTLDVLFDKSCEVIMNEKHHFSNKSFNPKTKEECIKEVQKMIDAKELSIDLLKSIYEGILQERTIIIDYTNDKQWIVFHGKGTREEVAHQMEEALRKVSIKRSPYGRNYFMLKVGK